MLQNRVDPQGRIIKTAARGAWMGNRGLIHNHDQVVVRPYRLNAWLICRLQFKDRRRPVMAPNQYTELFFLDEATAYAAGHRPCSECRRTDFDNFKMRWITANSEYHFDKKTPIRKIDEVLHLERINPDQSKVMFEENTADIPDGVFVFHEEQSWLVSGKKGRRWTPSGYEQSIDLSDMENVLVLTPKSIVRMFCKNFVPQMHDSALY